VAAEKEWFRNEIWPLATERFFFENLSRARANAPSYSPVYGAAAVTANSR